MTCSHRGASTRFDAVLVSIVVALAAVSCTLTDAFTKGEILIASDFPTSGGSGIDGRSGEAGVAYAIREVGSIKGFKLVHVPYDDALNGLFDAEFGARNFTEMVNDPKILGVVGPFNSSIARVAIPLANAAQLVLISPSNTNPCLTRTVPYCAAAPRGFGFSPASLRDPTKQNNYFRIAPGDDLQGPAMADFAIDTLKITRVAVWSDTLLAGRMAAETFSQRFETRGGTVVVRQDFEPFVPNKDFTPFLQRARDAGAQGIYAGADAGTGGCRARLQSKGILDVYYMGYDGLAVADCIRAAGDQATDKMYYTDDFAVAAQDPRNKELSDGLKRAFPNGDDLGAYTFHGYDAAKILIDAIGRAIDAAGGNMPSRRQVLDAVQNTKNLRLSTGVYSFDKNGDATSPTMAFYQVKNGAWTFFRQVAVAP